MNYEQEIKDSEFLFQLLDDIDTCSDAYRPEQNAFYKNVMELCQKRFEVNPKSSWIPLPEPFKETL